MWRERARRLKSEVVGPNNEMNAVIIDDQVFDVLRFFLVDNDAFLLHLHMKNEGRTTYHQG